VGVKVLVVTKSVVVVVVVVVTTASGTAVTRTPIRESEKENKSLHEQTNATHRPVEVPLVEGRGTAVVRPQSSDTVPSARPSHLKVCDEIFEELGSVK
jgi:hypothetical protein